MKNLHGFAVVKIVVDIYQKTAHKFKVHFNPYHKHRGSILNGRENALKSPIITPAHNLYHIFQRLAVVVLITFVHVAGNPLLAQTATVTGQVQGIIGGDMAQLTLGNDQYLQRLFVSNGSFQFNNVPPGKHFVKIDITGYTVNIAKEIIVGGNGAISGDLLNFTVSKLPSVDNNGQFSFSWQEDKSRSGQQQSAYVNKRPEITFINEKIPVTDLASAEKLLFSYNIIISNENSQWNQEYVYRLLETMKTIPQAVRYPYGEQTLKPSKWVLTSQNLPDDISVEYGPTGNKVVISEAAFVYATPKIVMLDGLKGQFFSQRLHHALVRYVTQNGRDNGAVEQILRDRYGCSIQIQSYSSLTRTTTKESEGRFQKFKPNELVNIINMFEEMPAGFHVIKELRYLVRRLDGQPHPTHPSSAAVAWTGAGYIEFMQSAFSSPVEHMQRLILHEKAHFMWAHLFSDSVKKEWIRIGGWFQNSNTSSGWSTTKQTEFVSAYAHANNPDEDMAESISYFVLQPDKLSSRSLPKFEFIRDRIMQGSRYISRIRPDLTFEVLNLFPDYNYPGKIKRVNITVVGKPEEDKSITIDLHLELVKRSFEGASHAYMRIFSESGTFFDLYCYPQKDNDSLLRGTYTLSKSAKSGLWRPEQITITDRLGNQRFEGTEDFSWRLFINNPEQDTIPPKYIPKTITLSVADDSIQGRKVQRLRVKWKVNENRALRTHAPVYARSIAEGAERDSFDDYGDFDVTTATATVDHIITEYHPTGNYQTTFVVMHDEAKNEGRQYFSKSPPDEPSPVVRIQTSNPDLIAPEIDLNKITVRAKPTVPEAPNGETIVTIEYYARDDKSGLGTVNYRLLDPQGISHFEYHYHDNFYEVFFKGDPTAWKKYTINVVLPRGSVPGIWGLQAMELYDKAGNKRSYSFVETIRFDIQDKPSAGNTTPPQLEIGTTSLNFANVNLGESTERVITLRNPSTSSEGLSGFIGITPNGSGFSLSSSSSGSFSIPIGQTLNVRVRFSPTIAKQYNANLIITNSASSTPTIIPLSGIGITSAPVTTGSTVTLRNYDPLSNQSVWQLDRNAPRDSGFIHGTNIEYDRAKATAFTLPKTHSQAQLKSVQVWFAFKRTGLTNQTYRIDIYNGTAANGPHGQPIASREYKIVGVNALNMSDLSIVLPVSPTIHNFENVTVGQSFFASVEFGLYGKSDITNAAIVASDRLGRRVAEDWDRAVNGVWYNMSDAWFTTKADGWNMWIEAVVQLSTSSINTSIESQESYSSISHYPNPCQDITTIQYRLNKASHVTLDLYSLVGTRLATFINEQQTAGNYVVPVDLRQYPAGQYFYRLNVQGELVTRSLLIVR